jgi:hypothetical protein
MAVGQMLTRTMTISVAAQLLLVGYCAGQTVDPGPIRVGDRWSYEIKDGFSGELRPAMTFVVAEVNDKEITTRVSIRGRDRPQTMVHDLDWGRIDDGAWQLRPPGIGIKKPLQIGNEWRSDANGVHSQSGATFRAEGVARVVGQERITTQAGSFDTFRVDMTVRMINTRDLTRTQMWTFVVWYAPEVNRWVKKTSEWRSEGRLRDSSSEELTEYSRRP